MRTRVAVVPAALVLTILGASLGLGACSSQEAAQDPASTEQTAATDPGIDPAMVELCDRMVAEAMTVEDATALAEESGYSARTGTIDGQSQAVTDDYRTDRFTFEVVDGVVTACQYG